MCQINGVDIQSREEAVAILTREDSTNISLLLARPDIEVRMGCGGDESSLEYISFHCFCHLYALHLRRATLILPKPC